MRSREIIQRAVAETLDRRLLLSAVTATANGAHEIDLNITPDSTAYSMQIGRSIDGTNYVTVYSGDVITAFPDTGLSADINYFYNVTDSDDNGSYTSTASATTGPVAPTVTASGNGSSEIDLAVSPDLMATSMQILRDGTQVYSGLPEDTFADTGLSADSTYSYVVNTSNSNGSSSGSASASTGAFAPSVTAVGNGSGEIDLNINADPTASWMQIVRNGASTYSGAVTSAFSDTGLSPDSSFTYTVTTGNAAGSTSGSVIGTTGLINPSVSAVGNGNNEIDLTISPDYDATSMQILRDGVSIYSSGIINSFADAGLGADATYAYTVITTNSIGSSSGSASGTTGPWNPTITATPVSANEIDLVLSSDSTATSIQITRDGAQIYSGASVAAFSDDALAADSSHIYVVTTSSSNGVSTASTSAGTAPAAPTVSAFANGPGEIDLTITPDPLATSMQVLDNGSTIYSGAVIPTFSDTGLSADSMHSLTVVTSDANGSSSASTTATTGILDPVVTAAANGPSEIDLSITPDYYATSMEILRNGVSIYLGGVASTYADTSLAADNSYTYTVITDSSMGSFSSSTGGATACTGPSAPAVAAVSNGGAEIDLTITPDSSATSMEILRDGNPIYSGAVIGTFADTGLVADASYDYAIVNGNSIGSSSASVSAATTFSNPGVSGFGVTGSQIDLTISSDPMTTSMQILRDGTQVYLGSPTNAFVDTGLSPDTAYAYTVITSFGTAGPMDATTGACTVTTGLGTSDPFSVTRGVMSVQEGDAYSGSVGTIADTNPDSSAANFSATFTFNGQSVTVTLAGSSGSYSLNVSNLGPFALSDSGARGTISVTEVGVTHSARASLRVTAASASISGVSDLSPTVGESWSGVVATVTDANPTSTGSNLIANILWSDGQTAVGTLVPIGGGVFNVTTSRVFTTPGDISATVTLDQTSTDNCDGGGGGGGSDPTPPSTTSSTGDTSNPAYTITVGSKLYTVGVADFLEVSVTDANGNPVTEAVTVTTDNAGVMGPLPDDVVTGTDGVAWIPVDPVGAGTCNVTVTDGGGNQGSAEEQVGHQTVKLTVDAQQPVTLYPGQTGSAPAQLTDANGNPITGASLIVSADLPNSVSTIDPAPTDNLGNTNISVTGSTPPGGDAITTITVRSPTDPGAFDTVMVDVRGVTITLNPSALSLSTIPQDVNHLVTVTATVVDSTTGAPVVGATINVGLAPGPNVATVLFNLGGGGLLPQTDQAGQFSFQVRGDSPGNASLSVSLPGDDADTATADISVIFPIV